MSDLYTNNDAVIDTNNTDIDAIIDNNFNSDNPKPDYLFDDYEDTFADEDLIKKLLIDMGELPYSKTLFRDNIINQMMAVLISESKPNLVMAGLPGTGKTKIAEELAHRIKKCDSSVPKQLHGYSIYMLNLADVVSGCCLVGDLERKVQRIVDYLEDSANKAIVFIDEFHMLFSNESYKKIAQILKPALSRGRIKTIAATTVQEINAIDTDPAFNRRFTRILVDELTAEQTRQVLMAYAPVLSKHYGIDVKMSEKQADEIIRIADEFLSYSAGSHRPDNALTLLDRSVSAVIVMNYADRKCSEAEADANGAESASSSTADVSDSIILDSSIIEATAFRMISGNSEVRSFNEKEFSEALSVIRGQDAILKDIMRVLKIHDMHIHPRNKPLTFLFAGSSGVGKTELSKIIAKQYFREKPIILNMTEYQDSASINKIIGAPAGYGNDTPELPFDKLDTNPYQVILLDEFEKGCRSIQRIFMSVFDEGQLKTAKGKTIDFSKCIIIATTNAGCTDKKNTMGFMSQDCVDSNVSFSELSQYFDVELINRFEHIYTFNHINEAAYSDILKNVYRREVAEIKKHINDVSICSVLSDEMSQDTIDTLVRRTYNPNTGARPIGVAVNEFIDELIISNLMVS